MLENYLVRKIMNIIPKHTTCNLLDHVSLRPRLDALIAAHQEDLDRANALEKRIANLLEQHATKVLNSLRPRMKLVCHAYLSGGRTVRAICRME